MTGVVLGAAAAFVGCCEAVVLAWFDIALLRTLRRRRREQAVARIAPEIRRILVDYLSGADKVQDLRRFYNEDAEALAEVLFSFRGAVGGGARERLCELTLELGMVRDWCAEAHTSDLARKREVFARLAFICAYEPCRRLAGDILQAALQEPDDEVRVSAARGLIQSGETETLESIFDFALSSDLLTRAVLAEDLRRHAAQLAERAIPEALSSPENAVVLAGLDVLSAWQRAVVVPELPRLLEHPDRAVRLRALGLAPMVPQTPEGRAAILRAIAESDPEVSGAAALSAGRLRMEESLPHLAALMQGEGVEVARRAAAAMAQMPPRGWKVLEEMTAGPNKVTAEVARAALVRAGGGARP
jgi:HEAT repeat protein